MKPIDVYKYMTIQAVMACQDEGLLDLVEKLLAPEDGEEEEGGEAARGGERCVVLRAAAF